MLRESGTVAIAKAPRRQECLSTPGIVAQTALRVFTSMPRHQVWQESATDHPPDCKCKRQKNPPVLKPGALCLILEFIAIYTGEAFRSVQVATNTLNESIVI
jgi:hypothetical protein